MNITEMIANDLEPVAELAAQLGYPEPIEKMKIRFEEIIKLSTHQLYVAKDSDRRLYGWIQVNRESDSILSDPRAEISALVVD